MKDKLVNFLAEMDKNDDLKQNYFKDPKETAERFGLEAGDVELCAANDLVAIKMRSDANGGDNKSVDIMR